MMKKIFLVIAFLLLNISLNASAESKWFRFQKDDSRIIRYLEVNFSPIAFTVNTATTVGDSALRITGPVLISSGQPKPYSAFCEEWVFVGLSQSTLVFDVLYDRKSILTSDVFYEFITSDFQKGIGTEGYANALSAICLLGMKDLNYSTRHTFYIPVDSSSIVNSISPRMLLNKATIDIKLDRARFFVGTDLSR
jgi:hypothetical protein